MNILLICLEDGVRMFPQNFGNYLPEVCNVNVTTSRDGNGCSELNKWSDQ
jgi:hypothetical protein